MANQRKGQDLEAQTRDIRKQLNDQIGSLEFRTESKIAMLNELQDFFKKRSEVEMEYMRGLDRLVEKCEKATKQRNAKSELHSTQLLWNSLLNETRKAARERGTLAEFYNTEMQVMLDIMLKDLHLVTKKCKEYCIEIQDKYLKELKDLLEAMKAYQYSSHNTQEAYNKLCRSKEKLDAMKQSAKANSRRKEQLESKEGERQQQYKENQQRQIKFRNEYLLSLHSCNAYSNQYFNRDLLDLIEQMDYDYHGGLHRIAESYRETEHTSCRTLMSAADTLFEQANQLSFDSDLQSFLKENGVIFTAPIPFSFVPFGEDVEEEIRLTESSYNDVEESMRSFESQAKTFELQVTEETKTLQHMTKNVLEKYKIVPCREPPPVPTEEPTEGAPNSINLSASVGGDDARKTLSMERDRTSMLAPQNVRLQMFHNSQKGKKEDIVFTLEVFHRKLQSRSHLSRFQAKYNLIKQAFEKAPPAAYASDIGPAYHLRELPKLFGGDLVTYIEVTRVKIPLIVTSCCTAIEARGLTVEGLFRVPGPAQHIEELRKEFEEGKNPLAVPGKEKYKTDINAIASTLKAYFRELQTPLFPMDKYTEFITCARKDSDERCAAIKATVHTLHSSVVDVMGYLFKFLFKVSKHSTENKMNSSNLALVFGPTLVQAPTHLEALQLHNDVPAVNMLIQVCIDQHDVIFPATTDTPPPPPVADEPRSHSISPLPQPVVLSEAETGNTTEQQSPVAAAKQVTEEAARVTSPPKLTEQDIEQTLDTITDVKTSQAAPDVSDQKQPPPLSLPPPTTKEQQEEEKQPLSPVATQQPPVVAGDAPSQKEQKAEAPLSPRQKASFTAKLVENENKEEEEDDVSDSDTDDDDEDVTTMTVKAIYNYSARNQKELSFSAGEILQVTEKTSDGNWWDGFHNHKRGYIPVTYVEIMEVRSTLKSPLPPERRSSTQTGVAEAVEATQEANEVESDIPNKQVGYLRQQSAPPLSPGPGDKDASPQPEVVPSPTHQPLSPTRVAPAVPTVPEEPLSLSQPRGDSPEETTSTFKPPGVNVQSATLPSRPKDVPAPAAPKMPSAGHVKNKMAQFLSSSQPQAIPSDTPVRPPSPGHRRMKSEGSNLEYKSVKQLTQAYNPGTTDKGRDNPPPTRPKPRPSAELTRNKEALEQAINFPIMPHTGAGATQVSPLQQKLFSAQTDPHPPPPQQQQQKPAVLTKPKGSFRKQPKKITKPPPPPQSTAPPKGAFVPPPSSNPRDPTALHEELRAVTARTRKPDKDTTV